MWLKSCNTLLALVLLSSAASAQEVACPARHPDKPNARLMGAGLYDGPNHEYELIGLYKPVPGGFYRTSGFGAVKWLACSYEPNLTLWLKLEGPPAMCTLEHRGKRKITARLTCK